MSIIGTLLCKILKKLSKYCEIDTDLANQSLGQNPLPTCSIKLLLAVARHGGREVLYLSSED